MSIMHLTKDNFDSITSSGLVLVDFWATWCGPCRMQAPILEEFDKQMEGRVRVCKLDVDEVPAIAQRFGVMSIPTVVLFENGQEKNRSVGLVPKEKLLALLPPELQAGYRPLLLESDPGTAKIVKAADKLSAYIKCVEELKAGNMEFKKAAEQTRRALNEMHMPELDYFMVNCMESFSMTLDELE